MLEAQNWERRHPPEFEIFSAISLGFLRTHSFRGPQKKHHQFPQITPDPSKNREFPPRLLFLIRVLAKPPWKDPRRWAPARRTQEAAEGRCGARCWRRSSSAAASCCSAACAAPPPVGTTREPSPTRSPEKRWPRHPPWRSVWFPGHSDAAALRIRQKNSVLFLVPRREKSWCVASFFWT